MITFNCSCGKKYQLPDRNAGREVRCNQCGKTLTVPAVSSDVNDNVSNSVSEAALAPAETNTEANVATNRGLTPPALENTIENEIESDFENVFDNEQSKTAEVAGSGGNSVISIILAAVITFLLGSGLGFVIGLKSGVPSPAVGTVSETELSAGAGDVSPPAENAPEVSGRTSAPAETNTETNVATNKMLSSPASEEEPPKKDKKSAVLDELGTILSEDKK
jgi:hypothetical protein